MDEAMKLLAAVEFWDDPLNLSREVPPWAFDSMCDCDPVATHNWLCPSTPNYRLTVWEHAGDSTFDKDWIVWLPWRWVCSGEGSYHTGGEINGFLHWCERERRLVTNDD